MKGKQHWRWGAVGSKITLILIVGLASLSANAQDQKKLPDWVSNIKGTWKGKCGDDNQELQASLDGNAVSIRYKFLTDGKWEEGTTDSLEFNAERTVTGIWQDKAGKGKFRIIFDPSFFSFSGTYGSGDDGFGSNKWTGINVQKTDAIIASAEKIKAKADGQKGKTLIFKGFYLGMPIQDAAVLWNYYLREALKAEGEEWPGYSGNWVQVNKADDGTAYLFKDKSIVADKDGKVVSFELEKAFVDILFKSQKMPQKEFLQTFVNAYDVPGLDAEWKELSFMGQSLNDSQQIWSHRSDKGYELKFYGNLLSGENPFNSMEGAMLLGGLGENGMKILVKPGTMSLKKIKTANQRQSAFD